MSISSSAQTQQRGATTASEESAAAPPITLSERSSTGLALLRILVGYLWFQQLFWKLPPTFAGLYEYVVRESQHTILPGYGTLLQHTFLAGCPSPSSPAGCTAFVPLAACVWTAELLVAISLLFGLFTRFGAILATVLSVQLYVGLAYTEWIWTYGMLVLLALALVAVPAGRRLGVDLWLAQRLQEAGQRHRLARVASWFVQRERESKTMHRFDTLRRGLLAGIFAGLVLALFDFVTDGAPGNGFPAVLRWFGLTVTDPTIAHWGGFLLLIVLGGVFGLIFGALQQGRPSTTGRALLTGLALGVLWWLLFEVVLANITNHASSPFSLNFASFLSSFPLAVLFGVLIGAIFMQWQGYHGSRKPS